MNKLLNWSELSRYITKGDRNGIRFGKIPKKHIDAMDRLFYHVRLSDSVAGREDYYFGSLSAIYVVLGVEDIGCNAA